MKNIVITPAIGMLDSEVTLFLASLRKFYDGEVLFFFGKKDHLLKKKIKNYGSDYIETDIHKHDIIIKRYKLLIDFLKKRKDIDNIFFCDSRDIYFQSNPFSYSYKRSLNFFSEDASIKSCLINSHWMRNTLGQENFDELKNKNIICCGTVMGTNEAIIKYASEMEKMSKKYPYKKKLKYLLTFRRDKNGRGCDQSYAAYLIYKNILSDIEVYSNTLGPIATVYHLSNYNFNGKNELINKKDEPYLVVHQYDKKWNEFENSVNKLKQELKIN